MNFVSIVRKLNKIHLLRKDIFFTCKVKCQTWSDVLLFDFIIGTGRGKLSEKAYLRYGKTNTSNGEKTTTYKIMFQLEPGFGTPGALIITNQLKHEFFIQSVSLQTPKKQIIEFDCGSWVYPFEKTGTHRIFFSNAVSYLYYMHDLFYFLFMCQMQGVTNIDVW